MKSLHFLYHELRLAEARYSYVTPQAEFEAHCGLFAHARSSQVADAYCPEITFDDGHVSDLTVAAPILERHGLRATFFVTAGWLNRRPGFMTWSQLQALQRAGHRVGAHGMTHKLLTECSGPELQEELQGARKRLEDGLGEAISLMSLPGGRANARVLHACTEAGFVQVFTSQPVAEEMALAPKTVGRLNLTRGTTTAWLSQVLDPATGVLKRLERIDQLKGTAKRLIGDRAYARIWALVNRQEPENAIEASVQ